MPVKPPPPPSPDKPTTRRNEVEQARRSAPVQAVRSRLKAMTDDDSHMKRLAEAVRQLLRQR